MRRNFEFDFGKGSGAFDGAAGASVREIGVLQEFDAEGAESGLLSFDDHFGAVLGGRIAGGEHGAVAHAKVLLAAGGDVINFGGEGGPGRLRLGLRVAACAPVGVLMFEVVLDLFDLAEDVGPLHLLVRGVDAGAAFGRVIQEGEYLVVLFLREGVELVVVALGAADGDAEDAFADGVDAVEHGFHAELLGVDAAFLIDH